MILNKDLNTKYLVELFSDIELSVSDIRTLFSFNNPSLNYPLLPTILLNNGKVDCLVEYLSNIKNIDYLMINFFSNNNNIPSEVMNLGLPYIDNILSISLDKLNLDYFISLNRKFPQHIGEHTILKLIKIYDNNQKNFLS